MPLFGNLLYRTADARPLWIALVLGTLALAVLCASLGPAIKAANTDPMRTLRQD